MNWNEVTWYSKLAAIIFFLGILPVLVFYIGTQYQKTKDLNEVQFAQTFPQGNNLIQSPVRGGSTQPSSPAQVLIYTEEVSRKTSLDREWPVVNIWKQVNSDAPELLATVGGIGEYPGQFSLSPNRKYLSIGLEGNIKLLDVETKEMRTIFTPTQQSGGAGAFSPDSKKIAVVDGNLYNYDAPKSKSVLYSIDLDSGSRTVLRQEESLLYDNAMAWREDGNIVVSLPVPKGCSKSLLNYYDPRDGKLHPFPGYESLIANGELIVTGTTSPNAYRGQGSMCHDGVSADYYIISEPVSRRVLGKIGLEGSIVGSLVLSPDGKQILFKTNAPETPEYSTYYLQNITGGAPVQISDYQKILSEWSADTTEANINYSQTGQLTSILIDGKVIVKSSNPLSIIAQYWD